MVEICGCPEHGSFWLIQSCKIIGLSLELVDLMNEWFLLCSDDQARLAAIFADQKLSSCHRGHYLGNPSIKWLLFGLLVMFL